MLPTDPHGTNSLRNDLPASFRPPWRIYGLVLLVSALYSVGLAYLVTGRSNPVLCLGGNRYTYDSSGAHYVPPESEDAVGVSPNDYLFNADIVSRLGLMSGKPLESPHGGYWEPGPLFVNRHPASKWLWPLVGVPLRLVLSAFLPHPWASLYASLGTVGLFFGLGAASLLHVALRMGMTARRVPMFLIAWLLATSQAVACLPESFGISLGMLSLSLALAVSDLPRTSHRVIQGILAVLLAGSTLTMAGFPILCAVSKEIDSKRIDWRGLVTRYGKIAAVSAMILVVVLAGLVAGPFYSRARDFVKSSGKHLALHRVETPFRLACYGGLSSVYPIIGPYPTIRSAHAFGQGQDDRHATLTYDPWNPADYGVVNGAAALAWIILFGASLRAMGRDSEARRVRQVLVIWIVFNTVFHLIWGDETFLYSPHWAFALFACVLVGNASRPAISARLTAALLLVLCAGQIETLRSIFQGALDLAAKSGG